MPSLRCVAYCAALLLCACPESGESSSQDDGVAAVNVPARDAAPAADSGGAAGAPAATEPQPAAVAEQPAPAPEMPAAVGANTGPCDQPSTAPGCDDPTIMGCVCGQDGGESCCAEAWDAICVGLVQGFECTGDCCRATGALGCADPQVESGVCAVSPGCCDAGWDEFCTVVAEANGACQ
jgi:hypothetical protein